MLIKPAPTSSRIHQLFATCAGGLDSVLKQEIEALPAKITHHYPGGVEFEGNLDCIYRACLRLRSANRVLLKIKQSKKIFNPDELYRAVQEIRWSDFLDSETTFSISFTASQTKERKNIANTQFLTLKAKDAIVDQLRQAWGSRPSVEKDDPDVQIRFHWHDHILKSYLDLSGSSLHARGYRLEAGPAPIQESLAAGLLGLAEWRPEVSSVFLDPFCGSGTFLIEALLKASNTAPGLYRQKFGFYTWKGHEPEVFDRAIENCKKDQKLDPAELPKFFGSDLSPEAIAITQRNLERTGLQHLAQLQVSDFETLPPPAATGWMFTNPPYGVRLGETSDLVLLYQKIGSRLKHHYAGWKCGVISSEIKLMQAIALRPSKKFRIQNGGLDASFFLFDLYNEKTVKK